MRRIHQDDEAREGFMFDLDEIARQGARRMLMEALEAEVEEYIESARSERDERGRALVVRNGRARERKVLLGAGAVELKAPRVDDRRVDENGNRRRFKSVILPPYMRYCQKLWIGLLDHAASFSSFFSLPSTSSPLTNLAPALTNATK